MTCRVMCSVFLIVCVSLWLPLAVLADPATSQHDMDFSGASWGVVVTNNGVALRGAIASDALSQISRSHSFNTTVTVTSISTPVPTGILVRVVVEQVLLPIPNASLQKVWSAKEVNSLLSQGAYNGTLALYPGPDEAILVTISVVGAGELAQACGSVCVGMIVMGGVVVGLMIVVFLVVMLCRCCGHEVVTLDKEE